MSENVLSPKQQRAIVALLTSRTQEEAAKSVGISSRQLSRWLADEAFRSALRAAESQLIEQAARRVMSLSARALDVLSASIDSPGKGRERAAIFIIEHLQKLRDRSIEDRLERLEASIGKH